jgi:hypothetical protein
MVGELDSADRRNENDRCEYPAKSSIGVDSRTSSASVAKRFRDIERAMVAIETGTRSIWVSEQVRDLGNVSALDADEIF